MQAFLVGWRQYGATLPRRMPPIYHITHLRNLEAILDAGSMQADAKVRQQAAAPIVIGHSHIKERRLAIPVDCGPRGCVGDYVPFYFCRRSPMLYVISKNAIEGYDEGQGPIIYLASSTERIVHEGLRFVFTDGNASTRGVTAFFEDLGQIDRVDWPLMEAQMWNDTQKDPDRCRRRAAEFLVHDSVPFAVIERLATMTKTMQETVRRALAARGIVREVDVRRGWYY